MGMTDQHLAAIKDRRRSGATHLSDIDALLGEIERLQSDLAAAIEREDALAAAIQTALDSPAMMGCHDIEVLGNAADCWRKAKAIQGPEL